MITKGSFIPTTIHLKNGASVRLQVAEESCSTLADTIWSTRFSAAIVSTEAGCAVVRADDVAMITFGGGLYLTGKGPR